MQVITHVFDGWDNIPSVSHLYEVEDSYIRAFEHPGIETVSAVSYVICEGIVVAFGSATYFPKDNYYIDDHTPNELTRKLWVEGLVSIKKGCGSMVLSELEKWLSETGEKYNVEQKIINVMSVSNSVGFYEEKGYLECHTGSRFYGADNIRMAKAIGNFDLETAELVDYSIMDQELLVQEIATLIVMGRKIPLSKFADIPDNIPRKSYVANITLFKFKPSVTQEMISNILDHIDDLVS